MAFGPGPEVGAFARHRAIVARFVAVHLEGRRGVVMGILVISSDRLGDVRLLGMAGQLDALAPGIGLGGDVQGIANLVLEARSTSGAAPT